ncbi:MAG: S4 domain-containing protein [Steroidobacteraceae bacterium]
MRQEPAQRLQKALAHLGFGSRRAIEGWIRAGRLTVNGKLPELGTRVRESDRIRLDGRLVHQRPAAAQQVFLCHRSPGEPLDAAAMQRSSELEALVDRLPRSGGRRFIPVSPMPRQDGGLEIVTSDGALAERLQRAVRQLTGEFSVRLHGTLDEAQLASVQSGALDGGERIAVLECEPRGGEGTNRWYVLSARGASGRDVRQLFERSGGMVSRVLRTRLGSVALDRSLSRGRFRRLAPRELDQLLGADAASTARRSSRRSPRGSRVRGGPDKGR